MLKRGFEATQYWTTTNIVDGLNALTICVEVCYSFPANDCVGIHDSDYLDDSVCSWYDVGVPCFGVHEWGED